MEQNGPFWPAEVHFGPFRSANRTLAIPDDSPQNANESAKDTRYFNCAKCLKIPHLGPQNMPLSKLKRQLLGDAPEQFKSRYV